VGVVLGAILPCSTHALWGGDIAERVKAEILYHKNEVSEYEHCRKLKTASKLPKMADFSEFRMTAYVPPFVYTRIGLTGKTIFTCLNSRAIHIELPASLSTDSAIMAKRRFRGRRGDVKVMYYRTTARIAEVSKLN
jgi:hypothetical protein